MSVEAPVPSDLGAEVVEAAVAGGGATTTQIRGSTLLLVGRILSMIVNLVTTALIVRRLSTTEWGAFSYALSIVALGETVVAFGLDRAITRFIPMYDEHKEPGKVLGSLVLVLGTMLALGVAVVLLAHGFQGMIGRSVTGDGHAVSLLLILIILSPIQALDDVLMGMFAVFTKPRAIFFRRYLLDPGLRLVVVLLLVMQHSSVHFLAIGYVIGGALGIALYGIILWQLLRDRGLLSRETFRAMKIPAKEIFIFTIPLLTSDLVYTVLNSSDAVLLGRYRNVGEVGAFRVIQPHARLNQIVMTSFALLFTPIAARMFARKDTEGINKMYWQTAVWMAVFSFPIFAITFSLARPLTVATFGSRYAGSAVYLSLLSVGYYFNAAVGHNGLTLKVFGKLRYIVVINIGAVIVNIAVNIALIPRYGALGAAIGTTSTLIAHNLFKQAGLRAAGISLFQWRTARVYLVIAATAGALLAVQLLASPPLVVGLALAGLASLLVIRAGSSTLNIEETFPELARMKIVRLLVGERRPGTR
jgi:O-antigen/teichoic acid export membrane protein